MQKNYNENLVAGAAIRDDKGRRISKLFEASHPKMTVGYAKNLIMPNDPTEQEFNFRQSGGGVIEDGVAVVDKVKGKSLVWNQKVKNATFINTSEWDATYSIFSVSGGIASVTASADGDNYTQQLVPMVVGHNYLYIFMAATDTANKNRECAYIFYGESSNVKVIKAKDDTNWHTYNAIVTCVSNTRNIVRLEVTKVGTSQFKNVSLIDLTQMFGAGNEPATYEEFLQRKPKVADEYAYNEGTIVNNKVEGCRTVGLNQFNPNVETEYLAVTGKSGSERYVKRFKALPGTYFIKAINDESIYVKSVINGVYGQANVLNLNVKITLDSYGEIWIYSETEAKINGLANDICINLSDPTINGQYFPYEKHELDLSWVKDIKDAEGVKLFEDGLKSAGTAFDEVRKNKAVKRLGVVDLGTLTPKYSTADKRVYYTGMTYIKNNGYLVYPKGVRGSVSASDTEWNILFSDGILYIRVDNYPGSAEFKAAMSGVMLIYELAEPIEVEYDEKSLTYPVVAGGTEEAIASEPSSAFRADIGYGIDAVKTILDLKARVEALEGK